MRPTQPIIITVLNWIGIKVTNKLIVKLMLIMLMSILKTAKNLLRKILFQPRFKPGISCLAGASVFSIRPPKHMAIFIAITNIYYGGLTHCKTSV